MSSSPYRQRTGAVLVYSAEKGYGFVRPDDGAPDCFCHHSEIAGHHPNGLARGQRVTFELKETPKGPRAVSVVVVTADSGRSAA